MKKEKLIKLAEDLYQSAFDANAYYMIMTQYREVSKKYNDEMNISPAFYQVVYGALQKACFMEIAKLYDKTKDAVSIGVLLKHCKDNIDVFPEVPYQHHLKCSEECFYNDEVKSQREILRIFNTPDFEKTPVRVELTFSEFLELYQKRFNSLSKKQENIRVQRNKIYAHNDENRILTEERVWEKNPVTYPDIQELIELCDGFILNREDRTQKDLYIELIDFATPENNIFKAINQFEIEGINNQLRIPDGIVFVNGIPVVVFEFKSAVKENTRIVLQSV